jgi:hypothetical protein
MGEGRFPKVFTGLEDPWDFAAAKTTNARLEVAGFGEVNTWLLWWPQGSHREESSSWTTSA